jgi:hypothetical protein
VNHHARAGRSALNGGHRQKATAFLIQRPVFRFSSDSSDVCVRFYRRADGTVLTRDCPVGLRQLIRKVSCFAGAALSALMSVNFSAAQTKPGCNAQTAESNQRTPGLSVSVTDPMSAAVSGAQVTVLEERTKKRFDITTNSAGMAMLSGLSSGSYRVEIKSPGLKTFSKTVSIAKEKIKQINARLALGSEEVMVGELVAVHPVASKESTVTHTFEGDLLRAGSPH